jgi:hypothetical protein
LSRQNLFLPAFSPEIVTRTSKWGRVWPGLSGAAAGVAGALDDEVVFL